MRIESYVLATVFLSSLTLGGCSSPPGTDPIVGDAGSSDARVQADATTKPCDADLCVGTFPFRESFPGDLSLRRYRIDVATTGLFGGEVTGGFQLCVTRARESSACMGAGANGTSAVWLDSGAYYVALVPGNTQVVPVDVRFTVTSTVGTGEDAMNPDVAKAGLQAFSVAFAKHDTEKLLYALTDYARASDQKREWVVDLRTSEVLWHLYIPHGENSSKKGDPNISATFSNIEGSHQSSLGMMRSAETYTGDFGYSFRLDGLEPGYNDRVRPRDIVVHPWFGSTPKYVDQNRKAAPTFGCPAVDQGLPKSFFDTMSNGVLHWYSFPDGDWSAKSTYRL